MGSQLSCCVSKPAVKTSKAEDCLTDANSHGTAKGTGHAESKMDALKQVQAAPKDTSALSAEQQWVAVPNDDSVPRELHPEIIPAELKTLGTKVPAAAESADSPVEETPGGGVSGGAEPSSATRPMAVSSLRMSFLDTGADMNNLEYRARFIHQANVDAKLVKAQEKKLNELKAKLALVLSGIQDMESLDPLHTKSLKSELGSLLDETQAHHRVNQEQIDKAEEIIAYMVRGTADENLDLWFGKAEETDREIWAKFGEDVIKASGESYDHWWLDVEHPRMLLAMVILLDQFRRNMFRNTHQMYSCDQKCQFFVKRAIAAGLDELLKPIERIFLCLVLTHAEDLETQLQCVAEWDKLQVHFEEDSPYHVFREIFQRHVAVVERFGRQPHRNELLGRKNSPEEEAFLKDDTFRFDLPLKRNVEGHYYFDRGAERKTVFLGREYTTYAKEKPANTNPDLPPDNTRLRWDNPDREMVAAYQIKNQGAIRIGAVAPNFYVNTTQGPLNLYEYLGDSWGILFAHPADFTPVCTTELGEVARLQAQGAWEEKNIKVLALSVDPVEDHLEWIKDINATQGVEVKFPLIDDKERRVSMAYGMLDTTLKKGGGQAGMTITVRSVFIISPLKRVQLILTYPASIGRNFNEVLRAVHALQLSSRYKVATPVNWQPGQDTVVLPFIPTEQAEEMFYGGVRKSAVKYLRYVADPEEAERKRAGVTGRWQKAVSKSHPPMMDRLWVEMWKRLSAGEVADTMS
eukprot:jgi/Mesvir1/27766/Mv07451-RA.1